MLNLPVVTGCLYDRLSFEEKIERQMNQVSNFAAIQFKIIGKGNRSHIGGDDESCERIHVVETTDDLHVLFPDTDLLIAFPERRRPEITILRFIHPSGKGDLALVNLDRAGSPGEDNKDLSFRLEERDHDTGRNGLGTDYRSGGIGLQALFDKGNHILF